MKRLLLALFVCICFSQTAFALCVILPKVSLRAGPGSNYKETWKVGKYMPLKRKSAGTKNGWIQVTDIDGETHWVYSAAVSEELTCVVVKMNYVALRQSPDEAAPLTPLKYADKYWPFKKVVRDDDGWYQVEDDFGGRHWIRQSHAWQPTVYSQISF